MEYNLPKITSAMLILTHACNLKCRYCFVHQEPSKMTYQTAFDAIQFLIKNAKESNEVPSINFFGGEPMLMWNEIIVPLVNWIRNEYKKPFEIGMTTNGTLLNEEKIKFMKNNNMTLLLSIDGNEKTQNYNRPYHNEEGSFKDLGNKLPLIIKNFPKTTFRMTTIPPTVEYLFDNIMFAKNNNFNNFFVIPNMFQEWSEEEYNILSKEIHKYSDYVIENYRTGTNFIHFSELERMFSRIKMINSSNRENSYRKYPGCNACGKCGLGASKFASIHPNGNIYACQEMTSNVGEENIFYIGNIYTDVIEEKRIKLIETFNNINSYSDKYDCNNCMLNNICDGGCVANNYLINNDINIVPNVFCWWQQKLLEEAIYIMQTLGNEQNEQFKNFWNTK